nr:MAG TPA: zinc-ribbon domain protein [Caudoviricetes sp.]
MRKLTHGFMKYKCESCNKEWNMWLENGIEDRRQYEKTGIHKPSPYMIKCPYCGGIAKDISGYIPTTDCMPLLDHVNRFENHEDSDCGVPVFGRKKNGVL